MGEAVPTQPAGAAPPTTCLLALLGVFNDQHLRSRAWRVAGAYALFASLWILFSDRVLRAFMSDPELLLQVSLYKGLGFVAATSLMLLILNCRVFGQIEGSQQALITHKIEIERFKRLYAALSQVNESILRIPGRDELFPKVCETLTMQGGFLMAWIGWCEPESRRIVPVARAGDENGCLDHVPFDLEGRSEDQGLGGVFREGRSSICNDLRHDPPTHA
ncbi:MAG: hypothetical protein Q8M07_22395, partial [Prosthecobacter sp.]|nr:hypothetical protein [Prosthecobacter sp.]